MIGRIGAAWLAILLAAACHRPAYDIARTWVERKAEAACVRRSGLKLWMLGEGGYLVTGQCVKRRAGQSGRGFLEVTEPITYLCRNRECTELAGIGDWGKRVRVEVSTREPMPLWPPATSTSGAAGDASEAQIRAQIDARAAAILACTDDETTAVQVEILADRTTISLVGKQAATPAEICVRAALADLKTPDEDRKPLTVRHAVSAE